MKHISQPGRWCWLPLVLLSGLTAGHAGETGPAIPKPVAPAPVNLRKAKPLGPPADNARCFVCHLNYQEEKFAVAHADKGVACTKCHGDCDRHCADEDNITAPDIMYARDKTGPACVACHEPEELLEIEKHKPDLEIIALQEKICTDCHGQHKLPRRTRFWDRASGKLVPLPRPAEAAPAQPGG